MCVARSSALIRLIFFHSMQILFYLLLGVCIKLFLFFFSSYTFKSFCRWFILFISRNLIRIHTKDERKIANDIRMVCMVMVIQFNFSCNSFLIPGQNMVCDSIHHIHHDGPTIHVAHGVVDQLIQELVSIGTHMIDIELANHQSIQLVGHCMQNHRSIRLKEYSLRFRVFFFWTYAQN